MDLIESVVALVITNYISNLENYCKKIYVFIVLFL